MDSSIEHLRPWLPWAEDEPQPLAAKVELLRRFRGWFDLGQDFVYGILDPEETEAIGGTGLHTRVGTGAFEIGYRIRESRTRHGLAAEAAAALTRAAFEICGVDRVEIRCDPANTASIAIPRRLGFREEATLGRRSPARAGEDVKRDVVVFTLFRDDLAVTPAAAVSYEAYDAAGSELGRG